MTSEPLNDVMPVHQHASFADTVYDAWLKGVECEVYVPLLSQWHPCFIRVVTVGNRGIVDYVEVVCKNTRYERKLLNNGELSEDLRIPPRGKTVDGSVVVIDEKRLLEGPKS